MSADKHPYRTGIITSIIATIIWSVFPGWSWTFSALGSVLIWRIPVWLILLLSAIVLGFIIRKNRKPVLAVDTTPEFYAYNKDQFLMLCGGGVIAAAGYPKLRPPFALIAICSSFIMRIMADTEPLV
jgi:hypothetical protein